MAVPKVRDAWGIEDNDPFRGLFGPDMVYAAKFKFVSGSPGYVGDLFILQGDALTDAAPMVLRRGDKGELIVI